VHAIHAYGSINDVFGEALSLHEVALFLYVACAR